MGISKYSAWLKLRVKSLVKDETRGWQKRAVECLDNKRLSGGGRSNSTCAFLEYPTGDRGYIGLETGHSLEAWRPASLL